MTNVPSADDLFSKVQPVIADTLGVPIEKVTLQARFIEELGADSLDVVELILSLEEALDMKIPNDEAEKLGTVQDLLTYLESKGEGSS